MAIKIGENGQILSVFPVIELHNFVFRAPDKSLSELIANNGLNKGLILSDQTWEKVTRRIRRIRRNINPVFRNKWFNY